MIYCLFYFEISAVRCSAVQWMLTAQYFKLEQSNCKIWGCYFACWRVWRSAKQRNLPEDWDPPSRHRLLWIFSNSYWYERRRGWKGAVMSVRVWFPLGSITHASLLRQTLFLHNIARHGSLWIIFIVLLMWIRYCDSSFAWLHIFRQMCLSL